MAKGRALLARMAPSSLAGMLVIWAMAGDEVCLRTTSRGGWGAR